MYFTQKVCMGKKIVFESFDIYDTLGALARHLNTTLYDKGIELKAEMSPKFGHGHFFGLDFNDGVSILLFDGQVTEDLTLVYGQSQEQPLRLLFGVENEFSHIIKKDGLHCQLGSLRCSMVCGKSGHEQQLIIPGGSKVVFYCIDIDRKKYRTKISAVTNLMPGELRQVFEDWKSRFPFFYTGTYHLGIAQAIQNIRHNSLQGAVRRVYIESQTLEVMSLVMKQFIEDLVPSGKQRGLRKRDMELILEARKRLLANLASPPTIRELAQMMGTNENKLKAGFRLLFDTSINKLLQDERLIKARALMTEESYPIKEIAKMVGYKHSAHFASKFKKRFGILPHAYLKSMMG